MPTGDAYSSGHLLPSLSDLHMFYLLRPILFRTCRYFTGLYSSNIPRYFLDFALMVTFWKATECDLQKYNLRREVDVWRGCTRYGWWNSRDKEHHFVSYVCILKYLIKLWKAHARFISCFLISKQKHTRGEKGYEFWSYVLILWL